MLSNVPFQTLPFDIQAKVLLRLLTKFTFAVWTFSILSLKRQYVVVVKHTVCTLVSPPVKHLGITIVHTSLGCCVD